MIEIEKFTVAKCESLINIMRKIDLNAFGIVFVVDENKLIGVITDGDIRRYILTNTKLDAEADQIMNDDPKFSYSYNEKQNSKIMKKLKIKALPILDEKDQIVDIQFLDAEQINKSNLDVPVVIMAGGKGTRLYPYTQILPKPLIPINDKTITEIILDEFHKFGCKRNYMIVNYKKELIKAFFHDSSCKYDLTFLEEQEFLGTAGGLRLLIPYIKETFFLNNCDILITCDYEDIVKYHKKSKNIITLVCALKKEVIPYGTIKTDENGQLKELIEKPDFDFLINTGLYLVEPEFIDMIPKDKFIHITDVIQNCIDNGLNVGVYPVGQENWMDMGQIEQLEEMRKVMNGE